MWRLRWAVPCMSSGYSQPRSCNPDTCICLSYTRVNGGPERPAARWHWFRLGGHQVPVVRSDVRHSRPEKRFYAFGQTRLGRYRLLPLLIRRKLIRGICVRDMNRCEQEQYGNHEEANPGVSFRARRAPPAKPQTVPPHHLPVPPRVNDRGPQSARQQTGRSLSILVQSLPHPPPRGPPPPLARPLL